MIKSTTGNLLNCDVEALVNTVNCVGFMGKGIALQFKQAYPENYKAYQRACRSELVVPGKMMVYETGMIVNPKWIINFPTKRHWRGKSRIADIKAGLDALVGEVKHRGIKSIAVPPLGCGNGGLDWSIVRPLIVSAFDAIPDVRVELYSPQATPDAKQMPVRTSKPNMTPARALIVKLIEQYQQLAYRLTLLEVQKLAYFLQEAGEPLRLKYEAGHYGPYAMNLNKVLERIEGHFTRGYGDSQKPDQELELISGADEMANLAIAKNDESAGRLRRVGALIEGYETPYGMELLSSVHWVAKHASCPATTERAAVQKLQAWNDRKRAMFREDHVVTAWHTLKDQDWL